MTSPVIRYSHHGKVVSVYEHLKGKHRDHCLCYSCAKFHPGCDDNCPTAQKLYQFDVEYDLVTPVWECPQYAGQEQNEAEMCSCETPCENCAGVDVAVPGFGQMVVICYDIPQTFRPDVGGYILTPQEIQDALRRRCL